MVQLSIDYDLQIVFHKENSIPGDREFCKRGVELICPKIKGSPGQASAAGFGTFPTVPGPQCQSAAVSGPPVSRSYKFLQTSEKPALQYFKRLEVPATDAIVGA